MPLKAQINIDRKMAGGFDNMEISLMTLLGTAMVK